MFKGYKNILLLSFLIFYILNPLVSQIRSLPEYRFKHLTLEDGLSNYYVYCTLRDSKGFMWIGTMQGLNRFDGYNFKVYLNNNSDLKTISHNTVKTILEYTEGILLIGTDNGFNLFNAKEDKFYRFFQDTNDTTSVIGSNIFTIIRDKENNIWVGTDNGLCKCQLDLSETQPQITFSVPPLISKLNQEIKDDDLIEFHHDSENNIWIGTANNGVFKINLENNTIKQFKIKNFKGDIISLISGIEEYNHKIWIGAANGAHTIDMKTEKMESYFDEDGLSSGVVLDILKDTKNRLWIATHGGLFLYHNKKDTFQRYVHDPQKINSLSNNYLHCLYDDGYNRLWLGTERGGINVLDENTKKFHSLFYEQNNPNSLSSPIVNTICVDNKRDFWIGTVAGGLNYYKRNEKKFIHYLNDPNDPSSLSNNDVSSTYFDKDNNLWIGSWGGGINILRQNKKSVVFEKPAPEHQFIVGFLEDKYDRMWVATADGIVIRNNKTGSFHFVYIPQTPDGVITFVGNLVSDKFGNVHAATLSDGFFVFKCFEDFEKQIKPSFDDVLHFHHSLNNKNSVSDEINTTCIDKSGGIWIGSRTQGITKLIKNKENVFDADSVSFEHYNESNGLCSNVVLTIQEDNNSNLWLSTAKGLSKFNPKTEVFKNYYVEDGLTTNEFFYFAGYKSEKGKLFYGTTNGMVYFHPDSIKPDSYSPQVMLTDLKIMNKSVSAADINDGEQYLKESISYADEVDLSYKDYIFSISFSSSNYTASYNNKFAYKLEGYDNDWIYTGADNRDAQYTNVPGGEYVFRVKAANSDGVWNKEDISLKINITPPFTKTLSFYALILFLLIVLILAIIRLRVSNLKKQAKILENTVKLRTEQLSKANTELELYKLNLENLVEERTNELLKAKEKAEESDKLKSAFLANMSHEIRTPMNSIIGFSQLLATEEDKLTLKRYTEIITNNSESLMVLINDILDISKIESDQLEFYNYDFEVYPVCDELLQFYTLRVEDRIQISFENKIDEGLVLNADIVRFKQIFINLINNAIKFTDEGFIKFGYKFENDSLIFYVQDSGIGIAKQHTEGVFNYFEKIEDNKEVLYRGTGIGLSLSKKLVELMGGKIWLDSTLGIGSTFYFTIPEFTLRKQKNSNN